MLQYSPLVRKYYETYRQKFKETHSDIILYQSVAQNLQHQNIKTSQQRILHDLSSMFTMLQVKLNIYPHPIITTQIEPYFQRLIADPLNHLDDWRVLYYLNYDYYSIYPLKHLMTNVHPIKNPTENRFVPDITSSNKINKQVKHDTTIYRLINARRDLDWYFKPNPKMSLTNQMLKDIFSTFLLSYRDALDHQIKNDNRFTFYTNNAQASNWIDFQSILTPHSLTIDTISSFMDMTLSKLLDLTNYLSRMIDYFQFRLFIY